jgi:hypothetical protein
LIFFGGKLIGQYGFPSLFNSETWQVDKRKGNENKTRYIDFFVGLCPQFGGGRVQDIPLALPGFFAHGRFWVAAIGRPAVPVQVCDLPQDEGFLELVSPAAGLPKIVGQWA